MAATYWFNLAKNHGFVDGNKRVALRAADVFLMLNGFNLQLDADEAAEITERLASGDLTKGDLVAIVQGNIKRLTG